MPEGDIVLYNNFKETVMEGLFNLATGGHALKLSLHNGYTPNIDTHTVWADVSATEYGAGSGYTAGGAAVGNQDVTQDNANDRGKFDADNVVWSNLGPLTPATPSHAILRDTAAAGEPLICYILLGTTATNGTNYTVVFNVNGVILLT